jgi:hypothetical protein
LPENALKSFHIKILPFMSDLYYEQLCQEYNDFVSKWPILKRNSSSDQYKNNNSIEITSDEDNGE